MVVAKHKGDLVAFAVFQRLGTAAVHQHDTQKQRRKPTEFATTQYKK